jgi:hypothetical protein
VGPDNLASVGPSAVGVGSEGAFTGVFSAGSGCFERGCLDFERCDFSVGGSEFHRCLGFFAAEASVSGGETGNGGLVGSSDGGWIGNGHGAFLSEVTVDGICGLAASLIRRGLRGTFGSLDELGQSQF